MISDGERTLLQTIDSWSRFQGGIPMYDDIANLVGFTKQEISRKVVRLRKLGLIYDGKYEPYSLILTDKARALLERSPIIPPIPEDDVTVVCRYEYRPRVNSRQDFLIYTDGSCSCGEWRCFHVRQAAADLPGLMDQIKNTHADSDKGTLWLNDVYMRVYMWNHVHGREINEWCREPHRTKWGAE